MRRGFPRGGLLRRLRRKHKAAGRDTTVMSEFASLIDKCIIFACCTIIYLSQGDFGIGVPAVLAAVIISGLLSYFENDRLRTALTAGFSVLSCFMPELVVFLPLAAYDMFFYKYQYVNLISVIPVIYFSKSASAQLVLTTASLLALAVSARYRMEAQLKLRARYNGLSDAASEMLQQLKKRNVDLIEKQDNELRLATLNERNRIAREIHDNVGHLLSSAILQSGAILAVNRDEKVAENLKTLNETLSQAMNSIRDSVHELYDESIDLDAQVKEIIKQFASFKISYEYQISGNPGKKLKYAFIAIIKEALSNIAKHSDATHASVILREHPAFYQLIVRDNGTVKKGGADDGLGLKNMADRVQAFKGNINIMTQNGFEIFISVPKEDAEIEAENTGRG